jgi:two-component system, sensor histidine kinase and response regulator
VEDNPLNVEVALGLLEEAPISVDTAENGKIASEMVEKTAYDLLLMDIQMPVMDGVAATKAIRANPRLRTLPIIAMTANAMTDDREKCLEAGMNDLVAKPIDVAQLFRTLLRWISPREPAKTDKQDRVSTAPLADTVAVPAIPGVDTKVALRRTGGNQKRYEFMLQRFADSQSNCPDEIRAAIAAHDAETAIRLAHSLKGVAANLGADAVAQQAAKTEASIIAHGNVESMLVGLTNSLNPVVAAIRKAFPRASAESGTTPPPFDAKAIAESLSRLKHLLENDDGQAADFLLETRIHLAQVLTPAEMNNLSGHVGDFAYLEALNDLATVSARLSLNLG